MDKLRIAFVINGSLDQVSGGFIYDRALIAALRAAGHQVDVCELPQQPYVGVVAQSLARAGWRWASHRVRAAVGGPRPPAAVSYDAVIHDELIHPAVFLPDVAGAPRGKVLLALVHNLRSNQPAERLAIIKTRVERRYLATVDGVVAVCAQTLGDARALAGRLLPGVVVYPGRDHVKPALDEAVIVTRAREPGPLRVLHVAAVRPHKGLARLLAALALARDGGLDFVLDVVGCLDVRRYARALRGQVARAGLDGRVRFHGQRSGAELQAFFERCQVFALPSDREAYSLACLEALGFGLPILATSSGGLGEMVTSGQHGLLLEPHDTAAWAHALRRLGTDRDALGGMAVAALARYRAHLTWREAAADVATFIVARLAAVPDARSSAGMDPPARGPLAASKQAPGSVGP
ncbi:MAG: glycosyltransferase family 4 protein [Myxococcales bacterium]